MSDFFEGERVRIVPDAYHATSAEIAEIILSDGRFVPKDNPDHYLGSGIYFLESASFEQCLNKVRTNFPSGTRLAVLRSLIKLTRCLDLHNEKHVEALVRTRDKLAARKNTKVTDAVAINMLTSIEGVFVVRSTIEKKHRVHVGQGRYKALPEKIFNGSRLYKDSEIYVCVKNHDVILRTLLEVEGE